VITTFDVIHDAVDPAGILRAIRPAGRCVCVDINCLERTTDNTGQIATPRRVVGVLNAEPFRTSWAGTSMATTHSPAPALRALRGARGRVSSGGMRALPTPAGPAANRRPCLTLARQPTKQPPSATHLRGMRRAPSTLRIITVSAA
jgi:hypothetical protein